MHNEDDDVDIVQGESSKGPSRRRFLLAGGGIGLATMAAGVGNVAMADGVKRAQSRPGYTVPLPKNWVADHVTDDVHPPIEALPAPLTANVNESNPLEIDFFLSMNNESGYLMLDRLLALSASYHVKLNFRPVFPSALITGQEGAFPYTFNYNNIEMQRIAKFLEIPFKYPNPQVVVQDTHPPYTRTLDAPSGEKNQKNGYYVSRMAAAAQLEGKGEAFLDSVFRMIWAGSVKDWPSQVIPSLESAGIDAGAMSASVKQNPKKFDDLLKENAAAHTATGHEGGSVVAFRQEPFPGQNRFDELFWTLQRNGLTRRPGNAPLPNSTWTG
jgi:2-hydroxychromene-2-carboxylate isomerase